MRRKLHLALAITLFTSSLTGFTLAMSSPASAATAACDAGVTAQNNITVAPKHGKIFYVDSGQGQNVDASYVAYSITADATKTNLWAKLDTLSGGVVSLANPSDASLPLGDVSSGSGQSAFFLLKAKGSTLTSQSHTPCV